MSYIIYLFIFMILCSVIAGPKMSLFRDEWVADGQAQSGDRVRKSSFPAMR